MKSFWLYSSLVNSLGLSFSTLLSMIPTVVATPSPSMEPFVRSLAMGRLEWVGSQTGSLSTIVQIKCRWGTVSVLMMVWWSWWFEEYMHLAVTIFSTARVEAMQQIIYPEQHQHLKYSHSDCNFQDVINHVFFYFLSTINNFSFLSTGPIFCARHTSRSCRFGCSVHNYWAHGSR